MSPVGSDVGEAFSIVERRFTSTAWAEQPWREIGRFTGAGSDLAAEAFALRQTTAYPHPARYRVLTVVVTAEFERATVEAQTPAGGGQDG